jgi:hypothetical protein
MTNRSISETPGATDLGESKEPVRYTASACGTSIKNREARFATRPYDATNAGRVSAPLPVTRAALPSPLRAILAQSGMMATLPKPRPMSRRLDEGRACDGSPRAVVQGIVRGIVKQSARFEPARAVVLLLGALLLVLDGALLFGNPVVGVSDNGDSWRVMNPAGIRYAVPHVEGNWSSRRRYVEPQFQKTRQHLSRLPSSAAFVAWAAKSLDGGMAPPGVMDLRQVGASYWLLLLAAVGLLIGATLEGLVAGALALWVLSDPAYLLYFNSFYADAAAFVGLFGVIAWLLRHDGEPWGPPLRTALSLISVLFFTCLGAFSKLSYAPLGIVSALAVLWASRNASERRNRGTRILLLTLAIAAVLAPIHFLWGTGFRAPRINRYNSVFQGIAVASKDPSGTLAALGVPPERRVLVGTNYFDERLSEQDRDAAVDVSQVRVALRYLEDPAAAVDAMRHIGGVLALPRATGRAHVTINEMDRGKYFVRTAAWHFGSLRQGLLGRAWRVWAWVVACLCWISVSLAKRRWSALTTVVAYLLAVFATQSVIAVLGDGFFALSRHLLAARLALDSAVVIALFSFARWVIARISPLWRRIRAGSAPSVRAPS